MSRLSLLAITILFISLSPALPRQTSGADLLLLNSNVITMNPGQPVAQAIAIRDRRVIWVGSNREPRWRFKNAAQTTDLQGATISPGIIDAHTHLMTLGETSLKLDLKDIASVQEPVDCVKRRVATARHGEWILGWGWNEGKWAANYPTHHALTDAAPDNPVFLILLHGFAGCANKKALDIGGINKQTRNPENGGIVRDPGTS